MHKFVTIVEMNLETDFTTADFEILKVVKKWTSVSAKFLPTQTSYLAICLDIYVDICRMPTGIDRVTTGSVCRLLYWNYNILKL